VGIDALQGAIDLVGCPQCSVRECEADRPDPELDRLGDRIRVTADAPEGPLAATNSPQRPVTEGRGSIRVGPRVDGDRRKLTPRDRVEARDDAVV
jgi:hypothetical protein